MKLMSVSNKGRVWSALEERLAASLVYRWLRDQGESTIAGIARGCSLSHEEVLHAVAWMRGKGIDLRVHRHGKMVLGEEPEPSTISLVRSEGDADHAR